jgi:hypothetical protein
MTRGAAIDVQLTQMQQVAVDRQREYRSALALLAV